MQVCFALSSTSVFSRTDSVTDSERFYHSLLDFLHDVKEKEEVQDLLTWWNRHVSHFQTSAILLMSSFTQEDIS